MEKRLMAVQELQGPNAFEIRKEYETMKMELMFDLFNLAWVAKQVDVSMGPEEVEQLGPNDTIEQVRLRKGEEFATSERQRVKNRIIELDLEEGEALKTRQDLILAALSPQGGIDPVALGQAA